jgi:hypothetical protein
MPPAESESSFRPDTQLFFNDSPPTHSPIPVQELTAGWKKKKKKHGSKGKDTPAKSTAPMEANE